MEGALVVWAGKGLKLKTSWSTGIRVYTPKISDVSIFPPTNFSNKGNSGKLPPFSRTLRRYRRPSAPSNGFRWNRVLNMICEYAPPLPIC